MASSAKTVPAMVIPAKNKTANTNNTSVRILPFIFFMSVFLLF
jgi:hypothetical protein